MTYATLDRQPAVPAEIAADVEAIAGLDDRPAVSFATEPSGFTPASVPRTGLGPVDLSAAYDIAPLYEAGVFGEDQFLAIVSFDTYDPDDITTFEEQFGIVDAPPIERIAVGDPVEEPGNGSGEVTLDIDVVRSVAPRARILNFEAPNDGTVGFAEMVDAIVADGRCVDHLGELGPVRHRRPVQSDRPTARRACVPGDGRGGDQPVRGQR